MTKKLIEDVFATQLSEIQCDEATIQIVHCFSANLSDEDSQKQYPQLWHHFQFCADCAEEYEIMMEMAGDGEIIQPDNIPPVPDVPTLWQQLKDAITITFPGFTPELADALPRRAIALQRGSDTGFEPVSLTLIPDTLFLDVDVALNGDASLRDIFCTIWSEDAELEASFEGSSIWVQDTQSGVVYKEETFNEMGDATLTFVEPELYDLGLSLAGETYLVRGVMVP